MGEWAATIVTENVPHIIRSTMFYDKMNTTALRNHVLSVEDQEALRSLFFSPSASLALCQWCSRLS
jgi:hypothetical protein